MASIGGLTGAPGVKLSPLLDNDPADLRIQIGKEKVVRAKVEADKKQLLIETSKSEALLRQLRNELSVLEPLDELRFAHDNETTDDFTADMSPADAKRFKIMNEKLEKSILNNEMRLAIPRLEAEVKQWESRARTTAKGLNKQGKRDQEEEEKERSSGIPNLLMSDEEMEHDIGAAMDERFRLKAMLSKETEMKGREKTLLASEVAALRRGVGLLLDERAALLQMKARNSQNVLLEDCKRQVIYDQHMQARDELSRYHNGYGWQAEAFLAKCGMVAVAAAAKTNNHNKMKKSAAEREEETLASAELEVTLVPQLLDRWMCIAGETTTSGSSLAARNRAIVLESSSNSNSRSSLANDKRGNNNNNSGKLIRAPLGQPLTLEYVRQQLALILDINTTTSSSSNLKNTGNSKSGNSSSSSNANQNNGKVGKSGMLAAMGIRSGSKIEANYHNSGHWYPGVVSKVHGDGDTCDVDFDDGEKQARVEAAAVRLKVFTPLPPEVRKGCKIEANYHNSGQWYPGVITALHEEEGSCDVHYDDGETENGVGADSVRLLVPEPLPPSDNSSSSNGGGGSAKMVRIEVGSRIEANYHQTGHWYNGHVKAINGVNIADPEDVTYDVAYDDGEAEQGLPKSMVRAKSYAKLPHGVQKGTKVEANYRGSGTWYPGTVTAINTDGTCDIAYDDGELESSISGNNVRLRKKSALPAGIREGSRCEVNYRGSGEYYPGVVSAVYRDDGTADIHYDDGEVELQAPGANIKLTDVPPDNDDGDDDMDALMGSHSVKLEGSGNDRGMEEDEMDMDALMGNHSVGGAGPAVGREGKEEEEEELLVASRKPSSHSLHSQHSSPAPDTSGVPDAIDFRTFCRLTDRIMLDRAQDNQL